jgi:hypothetical protein
MPVQEFDLETIKNNFVCPKCEQGFMIYKNIETTETPKAYIHYCECCGCEVFLNKKYPLNRKGIKHV